MADTTDRRNDKRYEERSGTQMLAEIGRLLLVLLGKLMRQLWKYIKKLLRWLLVIVCKGLLWLIDLAQDGWQRWCTFWNDNDTQDKVRKVKASLLRWSKQLGVWCVQGLKAAGRGLLWLGIHLWQWFVWALKKTIEGIIHLRPTLGKLWRGVKCGWRYAGAWLKQCGTAVAAWWRSRCDAYRKFRQNKGFRGLLVDIGNGLKGAVNRYIEDEQSEEDENVKEAGDEDKETEMDTDLYESRLPEDSHVHSWGKRFYNAMKRIVEV